MKIYYSPTSPFVRKCLVVAHELGIGDRLERVPADAHPVKRDRNLVAVNPLGQVPALVTDDGAVLYDSRVIAEYLNDLEDGGIFPGDGPERWRALTEMSLADGMTDAALLTRYETAARPEALRWAKAAAEAGVASSMTRLGMIHHDALGVERDAGLAAEWWRRGAEAGDADAMAMLGAATLLGQGVDKNPAGALALLLEAERNGSLLAAPFVKAARGFFESWLIRKDYETAFLMFAPESYACYDLERSQGEPAVPSADDAGRRLRMALEASGNAIGPRRSLDEVIEAAEPFHSAIRVMDHSDSDVFSLSNIPNALADAAECAARAAGSSVPDPLPLEYGSGFGTTVRFKTRGGDAPVLRLVWRKEADAWRIRAYGVELP